MNIAAAVNVKQRLMPGGEGSLHRLRLLRKPDEWDDSSRSAAPHMQGTGHPAHSRGKSGFRFTRACSRMILKPLSKDAFEREIYRLALGGTAVGTGISMQPLTSGTAAAGRDRQGLQGPAVSSSASKQISTRAGRSWTLKYNFPAPLRTLAVSLYKIANDIRLMSCGPRAGLRRTADSRKRNQAPRLLPGKVKPDPGPKALAMVLPCRVIGKRHSGGALAVAAGYLEMKRLQAL